MITLILKMFLTVYGKIIFDNMPYWCLLIYAMILFVVIYSRQTDIL
jgi:hypothetical protein